MKEIKYCPYCRAEVLAGQKFCASCGKKIPEVSTTEEPQKKDNKVLAGSLVVGIVVVSLILIFVLNGKNESSTDSGNYAGSQYQSAQTETTTDEQDDDDAAQYDEFQPDGESMGEWDKYDFTSYREVTYSDLADLSKAERRIMRNWIYAKHGYIFKSQDLRDYFSQFVWYEPVSTDVTSELSKLEKQNIEFIKSYE